MATKTANLYARIEPDVKAHAESILSALGIPVSNAINMFYKQIILHRGIPFDLNLPEQAEMDMGLEKGYRDILAGRTRPANQVFADIRREYHI